MLTLEFIVSSCSSGEVSSLEQVRYICASPYINFVAGSPGEALEEGQGISVLADRR
jgi:hypothetical protein